MEPVFPFDVSLPTRGAGRIARDLHQQLRAAILEGRLVAGAELPATRRVADALGIGRNTAVTAYDLLIAEGYVVPRAGAKAVVAEIAQRRSEKARSPRAIDRKSWLNVLPSTLRENPTVHMELAESLYGSDDYKGLEASLKSDRWDNREFVRQIAVAVCQPRQSPTRRQSQR